MMEIVLSASTSARLSQESSVARHKEQCLHPQPVPTEKSWENGLPVFVSDCLDCKSVHVINYEYAHVG